MQAVQIEITPTVAADMIMGCAAEFQRQVSKTVVKKYAADMAAGRWVDYSGGPIEIVQNGNGRWIVNGQHRLHAVVESGVSIKAVVITHHATMTDAQSMYAVYDSGKGRVFPDVAPAIEGITRDGMGQLGSALTIIIKLQSGLAASGGNAPVTMSHRVALSGEWSAYYKAWREVRGSYDFVKKFDNAPTIAAAMYTLRYAPEFAGAFWKTCVSGDAAQNTGERKLRDFLLSDTRVAGTTSGGGHQELRLRACSICWNAAFDGGEIKSLRLDRKGYKITFAGTPLK